MIERIVQGLPSTVQRRLVAAEQRVRVAHWIGRSAVEMGGRELVRRIDGLRRPSSAVPTAPTAPTTGARGGVVAATGTADTVGADVPPPFEGYDDLTATQLLPLLDRLESSTLRAVHTYESAHRGRRTVLGRVDQLLAAS